MSITLPTAKIVDFPTNRVKRLILLQPVSTTRVLDPGQELTPEMQVTDAFRRTCTMQRANRMMEDGEPVREVASWVIDQLNDEVA